jgi:porin
MQDPADPQRGWGVFGDLAWSDGNPNIVRSTILFGIGGSSLLSGRPNDRFGVGYFRANLSDVLEEELAPFVTLEDGSGIEAFCNVALTPWLRFTGDVQFTRSFNRSPSSAFRRAEKRRDEALLRLRISPP